MAPIKLNGCGREERGAALVEFALSLPLLLVVIGGIVDFGFVFQRYEVLTNAAREGARMASLPAAFTDDQIKTRIREYVRVGLGLPTLAAVDPMMPVGNITIGPVADLTVGTLNGSNVVTQTRTVSVHYQHNWLLLRPVLRLINRNWGTSITLRATSQMVIEPGAGS